MSGLSRVLRYLVFAILTALALSVAPGIAQQGAKDGEWRAYAGDAGSTRYAPYELITRDNAKDLQVAWSWKFDNFGGGNSETTPHHGERHPVLHGGPAAERHRGQPRHRRDAVDVEAR